MTSRINCGCGWSYQSDDGLAHLRCTRAYEQHIKLGCPLLAAAPDRGAVAEHPPHTPCTPGE